MPIFKNAAQYRIGDFAHFLGVTPDFLKHYEEKGLLKAQHKKNGYRFFGFEETYKVVEFMRLRNYGASVRDMGRMLCTNTEDAFEALDEKAAGIAKEIERQQALLEEHRQLKAWMTERRGRRFDWEVREVENLWFLPHSDVEPPRPNRAKPVWTRIPSFLPRISAIGSKPECSPASKMPE